MTKDLTIDEWLKLACEQEALAKACAPFDPTYDHLMRCSRASFNQALILEKKRDI